MTPISSRACLVACIVLCLGVAFSSLSGGARAQSDPQPPSLLWRFETDGTLTSTPTLADIDHDGVPEVLVASEDDRFLCLEGDGSLKWARAALYEPFPLGSILSSPAVADVTGDGWEEIVVGSDDGLLLLDANGEEHWTYSGSATRYISSPALGDLDGDGSLEIVVGSVGDYKVKAIDGEGDLLWSYQTGVGDFDAAVLSSPAVADLDRDGRPEIAIGIHNSVFAAYSPTGESLWKVKAGHCNLASPSVADIDGDGVLDLFSGSDNGVIYAVGATRGEERWDHPSAGPIMSSPAIGDMNGDGGLEMVIGSEDGNVFCFGACGEVLWSVATGGRVRSSPALADLDGDGRLEAVAGSNDGKLWCVDAEGAVLWTYDTGAPLEFISPVVGDVNGDGRLEVLTGSTNGDIFCLETSGPVAVGGVAWGMFKHDAQHTGLYDGISVSEARKARFDVSIPTWDAATGSVEEGVQLEIRATVTADSPQRRVLAILLVDGEESCRRILDTVEVTGTEVVFTWRAAAGTHALEVVIDPFGVQSARGSRSDTVPLTVESAAQDEGRGGGSGTDKGEPSYGQALWGVFGLLVFAAAVGAFLWYRRRR